jgi:hypothetical protein
MKYVVETANGVEPAKCVVHREVLRNFSSWLEYPDGRVLMGDTSSGDWVLVAADHETFLAEGDESDKKLPKGVSKRDVKDVFGE